MAESPYERARRFSADPIDADINDAIDSELHGKHKIMDAIRAYHHESSKDPWYHATDHNYVNSLWKNVVDAHGGNEEEADETYRQFLKTQPHEEGSTHTAEMRRY